MDIKDLEIGQTVYVTTRKCNGVIKDMFQSESADTLNNIPAGTWYVRLAFGKNGKRREGFNYPSQLETAKA